MMRKSSPEHSTDSGLDSATRTSNSLIDGVKQNQPDAWNRLVDLYSPLVYFWCQQSGLPTADLNDIFQDVFHTLARNINKFRPVKNGSFRGWLRTMTRNKVNDHFRKAGREPQPFGGTEALHLLRQFPATTKSYSTVGQNGSALSDQASTLDALKKRETQLERAMLRRALSNIRDNFTEQTWQAFWMVVVDGRETNDVAADLEMRPGTVRVAKSRVLKRLRQEVGDSIE